VTYEELTEHTTSSLERLSSFLRLSEPLQEEYRTRWYTGVPGIGDPSDRIKAGRIRKSSGDSHPEIDIPNLDRCQELYEKVLGTCRNNLYAREEAT
jgi:hypothetical protein